MIDSVSYIARAGALFNSSFARNAFAPGQLVFIEHALYVLRTDLIFMRNEASPNLGPCTHIGAPSKQAESNINMEQYLEM